MKGKTIIFIGLFSLSITGQIYSFGIGLQFNANTMDFFAPGVALAVSPSDTTHLAFNWYFGNRTTIGLTADIWVLDMEIVSFKAGTFNFFLGPGLYVNLTFDEHDMDFHSGVRIPVGVNLRFGRNGGFEIYTHLAPSFGVRFYPSLGWDNFAIPLALGGRFWIR